MLVLCGASTIDLVTIRVRGREASWRLLTFIRVLPVDVLQGIRQLRLALLPGSVHS